MRKWFLVCLFVMTYSTAALCANVTFDYSLFLMAHMPNPPLFRPQTVSCTPNTHVDAMGYLGWSPPDQEHDRLERMHPNDVFEQLRKWADANHTIAGTQSSTHWATQFYGDMLIAKIVNDSAARFIYGKTRLNQFDNIAQLAYTYIYLPMINNNDAEVDKLFLKKYAGVISADYYYGKGQGRLNVETQQH